MLSFLSFSFLHPMVILRSIPHRPLFVHQLLYLLAVLVYIYIFVVFVVVAIQLET